MIIKGGQKNIYEYLVWVQTSLIYFFNAFLHVVYFWFGHLMLDRDLVEIKLCNFLQTILYEEMFYKLNFAERS